MPVTTSLYRPPIYLPGGQLQTLVPAMWPRPDVHPHHERIILSDGDFIDLDWHISDQRKSRLIVATHGLEGSSSSGYILDLVAQAQPAGFDVLAWNCRSCSEEINRLNRLYHHGDIEDMTEVIDQVIEAYEYDEVHLIGYSMGGSLTVRYMALEADRRPQIKTGVAVSTPFRLGEAARALDRPANRIMRAYFKKKLKRKLAAKEAQFPGTFPMARFEDMVSLTDIDEHFTAPYCGYDSADHFYEDASAIHFIDKIAKPLYAINAVNDPVLSMGCHPVEECTTHPYVTFELSRYGGHVYFPQHGAQYVPQRALRFIDEMGAK